MVIHPPKRDYPEALTGLSDYAALVEQAFEYHETRRKHIMAITNMQPVIGDTVNVPVKSDWTSKINWTQFVGIAASLGAYFGLALDPGQLLAVVGGVQAAVAVTTVIMRTYFTQSVSVSSATGM